MSLRLCLCLHVRRDHIGNCRRLGWCPRGALPSVPRYRRKQKMAIDHVLAVVPVADFEAAHAWYERLFGRPADNLPMEGLLVEWRVTDSLMGPGHSRRRSRRLGPIELRGGRLEPARRRRLGKGAGPRSDRDGEQGRAAIRHQRSRGQHHHLHRGLPRRVLKARAGENQIHCPAAAYGGCGDRP
jgi:hypothetical protein